MTVQTPLSPRDENNMLQTTTREGNYNDDTHVQHQEEIVERLLSERLLQGFLLLEKACPACSTPLVKQALEEHAASLYQAETSPRRNAQVLHMINSQESTLSSPGDKASAPIQGLPFCVSCTAHVVTDESEIQFLDTEDLARQRGSILVAMTVVPPVKVMESHDQYEATTITSSSTQFQQRRVHNTNNYAHGDQAAAATTPASRHAAESPIPGASDSISASPISHPPTRVQIESGCVEVKRVASTSSCRLTESPVPGDTPLALPHVQVESQAVEVVKALSPMEAATVPAFSPRSSPLHQVSPSRHAMADAVTERVMSNTGFDNGEDDSLIELDDTSFVEVIPGSEGIEEVVTSRMHLTIQTKVDNTDDKSNVALADQSHAAISVADESNIAVISPKVVSPIPEDPNESVIDEFSVNESNTKNKAKIEGDGTSQVALASQSHASVAETNHAVIQQVRSPVPAPEESLTTTKEKTPLPEYAVRRDIATKVLGAKMLEGYSLTEKQCATCSMPLMECMGETECLVCPVLEKQAIKTRDQERKKLLAEQKATLEQAIRRAHDATPSSGMSTSTPSLQGIRTIRRTPRNTPSTPVYNTSVSVAPDTSCFQMAARHATQNMVSLGPDSVASSVPQQRPELTVAKQPELVVETVQEPTEPPTAEEYHRQKESMLSDAIKRENQRVFDESRRLEMLERRRIAAMEMPAHGMLGDLNLQEQRKLMEEESLLRKEIESAEYARNEAELESRRLADDRRAMEEARLLMALEDEADKEQKAADEALARAQAAKDHVASARRDILAKTVADGVAEAVAEAESIQRSQREDYHEEIILPTSEELRRERWETLRAEGRSVMTRRIMAGWTLLPEFCRGTECESSPLLCKSAMKMCVVCGGCGSGLDSAYALSDDSDDEGEVEDEKSFEEHTTTRPLLPTEISTPTFRGSAPPVMVEDKHGIQSPTKTRSISQLHDDFETKRNMVSKEIGKRMLKGWTLLDMSCPNCVMPLMTDLGGKDEICVLCGLVGKLTSRNMDLEDKRREMEKVRNAPPQVQPVETRVMGQAFTFSGQAISPATAPPQVQVYPVETRAMEQSLVACSGQAAAMSAMEEPSVQVVDEASENMKDQYLSMMGSGSLASASHRGSNASATTPTMDDDVFSYLSHVSHASTYLSEQPSADLDVIGTTSLSSADIIRAQTNRYRNHSPRGDPPAQQGYSLRRSTAVDAEDSRLRQLASQEVSSPSSEAKSTGPKLQEAEPQANEVKPTNEPEMSPKASASPINKDDDSSPLVKPAEADMDMKPSLMDSIKAQKDKELDEKIEAYALKGKASTRKATSMITLELPSDFDSADEVSILGLIQSGDGTKKSPLGVDTFADVNASAMRLPSPGMTEVSIPTGFVSPTSSRFSGSRGSSQSNQNKSTFRSNSRSRPRVLPESLRARSNTRPMSNSRPDARTQPEPSSSVSRSKLPPASSKTPMSPMSRAKANYGTAAQPEIIVIGGPFDNVAKTMSPSVASSSSSSGISVGSSTLDALLIRIDETKAQLEDHPNNTTNEVEKQARLKSLIDNLAAAAVAVQELDHIADE